MTDSFAITSCHARILRVRYCFCVFFDSLVKFMCTACFFYRIDRGFVSAVTTGSLLVLHVAILYKAPPEGSYLFSVEIPYADQASLQKR
jgi:hypothetical protein